MHRTADEAGRTARSRMEFTMKRVHYLAGAAGLAPVALGLAVPTTAATAATTAHVQAGAAAASSSSATPPASSSVPPPAGSSVTPAFGNCTTSHYQTWPRNGKLRGHFWWAEAANITPVEGYCVGTAVLSVYFTKNICKSTTVHFSGGANITYRRTLTACGTKSHWTKVDFGVGDWEWGSPHIAGYSEYSGGKHVTYTF
jgi:hypothetical protein